MKVTLVLAAVALAIAGSIGAGIHRPPTKMPPFIDNILKTVPREQIIEEVERILNPQLTSSLDDKLKNFLNSLKKDFPTGMPKLGIPPLDPFKVFDFPFDIDLSSAKLKGDLHNFSVIELSDYIINYDKLKVLQLTVSVNFSLPVVKASGHYDINGTIIDLLPVFGGGNFHLNVTGFNASVSVEAGTDSNGYVFIRNVGLGFHIDGIGTNFEGLIGGGDDGELANELISRVAPEVIDAYSPEICDMLSDKITEIANKALTNVTLGDIISIIGG